MDSQYGLTDFQPIDETSASAVPHELRIYRPNGALSMIYVMTFVSDAKAIVEARKLACYGYQVDVWRDGVRTSRISSLNALGSGEDGYTDVGRP
jgi:hypothetical protein